MTETDKLVTDVLGGGVGVCFCLSKFGDGSIMNGAVGVVSVDRAINGLTGPTADLLLARLIAERTSVLRLALSKASSSRSRSVDICPLFDGPCDIETLKGSTRKGLVADKSVVFRPIDLLEIKGFKRFEFSLWSVSIL